MSRISDLEQNLINAAVREVHSKAMEAPELRELLEAIQALVYACDDCNYGRHICPGCGASVEHAGTGVCPECTEWIEESSDDR